MTPELLWVGILTGAAGLVTSISLLLKAMTAGYGKIIDVQNSVIASLTEQNKSQQRQIDALKREQQRMRKLRMRDRRECRQELDALKEEMMDRIRQCPVLMGEAPNGACPYKGERRDDPTPSNEPRVGR